MFNYSMKNLIKKVYFWFLFFFAIGCLHDLATCFLYPETWPDADVFIIIGASIIHSLISAAIGVAAIVAANYLWDKISAKIAS